MVPFLFGVEDPGSSISAILQIGSVLAVLYYFKKEIFLLFKSNKDKLNKSIFNTKLITSISLGTLSILFLGGIIKIYVPSGQAPTINLIAGLTSVRDFPSLDDADLVGITQEAAVTGTTTKAAQVAIYSIAASS